MAAAGRLAELATSVRDAVTMRVPPRHALGPDRLAVVAFHRVHPEDHFDRALDQLCRRSVPVSLDQVADAALGGPPLPGRAVLLTFDDGHRSVLEHGLPILRARGVPAVLFVVTDLIDTDQPFWWDEVVALVGAGGRCSLGPVSGAAALVNLLKTVPDADRRQAIDELRASAAGPPPATPQLTRADLHLLQEGGVAIGSHSLTHPILVQCDDESVDREVSGSRKVLADMLGTAPRSIAYPSGRVDQRVVDAARGAGYELGFAWHHSIASWPPPDPFRIPRLHCDAGASRSRLVLLAEGRHRSLAAAPPVGAR